MPDGQTIFEFRLACSKQACPICTLVQRAGARYIEGTLSESMLDPDVRQRLADSVGFCHEHTWLSINLKLSDALGHAILFRDLVTRLLNSIQQDDGAQGAHLAAGLKSTKPCPACQVEQSTLERVISCLPGALRNREFLVDFAKSKGFCFPHLRILLPELDAKAQAVVINHQLASLEDLRGELAEFIRKSDYRFRDEDIGKEGDSYRRAADMIIGKHAPTEKKDLR